MGNGKIEGLRFVMIPIKLIRHYGEKDDLLRAAFKWSIFLAARKIENDWHGINFVQRLLEKHGVRGDEALESWTGQIFELGSFLESEGAGVPFGTISVDLFFQTYAGIFPLENMLILNAIKSIIGQQKYRLIRENFIRLRTNGFSNAGEFRENPGDLSLNLTDKQWRNRIDSLERRGFFSTMTIRRRNKYFSTCLSKDQLRQELEANGNL